ERQRRLKLPLAAQHVLREKVLAVGLALRREDEAHAAAGHASEHPEAPEVLAELRADVRDQRLRVDVADPRDDVVERAEEVLRERAAEPANVALLELLDDPVDRIQSLLTRLPLDL